ncbi:MAG: aminomethyl-transferring glycine dehydrogenase subunit GcvPB [gamma proteobacterium symbiont of Bathyaustriella thionipta]|nr:aminomethyl-transferring glycine dehydrogenase subunit GcvPB [gamma proteobacterium symbiont of Bathyaustriella thionipta]MCU7948474.1 aminomethyl-transferring glycine dehydrogenase subunit GcvPB [gamma proteobacterium symbiont of Bathyaustriella thionipta]MCU7952470.1 aminomethyl-transferring glycine dehydrogenase subunit GcvPB [gamma proteobacterium symbiont of Bathyaustriella thionipta]MCU7956801.1 aminomethyl-transferring glycine dehydrogenase subunit GcvPB [gamma proteobacterium symbiont
MSKRIVEQNADTLIFELSDQTRRSTSLAPDIDVNEVCLELPDHLQRKKTLELPQVGELQVLRHYTRLSQKNFSIDTHFYPLGSCTMKYNPRVCNTLAQLPGFTSRHPMAHASMSQGVMSCLFDLQTMLKEATGMKQVSLTPMAGAQGEFAGVAMIRAYHDNNNDTQRSEIIVPDAAHGTNPATAVMCGYKVKEIPTNEHGDIDIEALEKIIGPQTAGIMLTNPSTLGVFERKIKLIADMIHKAGGLLYYDGANLNAILGKVKPGDMGFDVIHMNLHKTFSTPHGGGGPGSGPIGVSERLQPFVPVPIVGHSDKKGYYWITEEELPLSIGRLSAWMGNVGILLRAYIYALLLGRDGMERVADFATLNANYLLKRLMAADFEMAFPERRASHEFILTLRKEMKEYGTSAMDFAKRLLDYGFHAPTTYFPLLVPECFLIEPTETESRADLDAFVETLIKIREEAEQSPDLLKGAPFELPVRRLDDVKAARELDLNFYYSEA